jgi:hypothetical protein
MIPREILKNIRPVELRPNRSMTASAASGCARIPTGFRLKAQGCEERATLGCHSQGIPNRNAVVATPSSPAPRGNCHNPIGVDDNLISFAQGSACVATLGWMPESRWDSPMNANVAANFARADSSFIIHPSSFPPA